MKERQGDIATTSSGRLCVNIWRFSRRGVSPSNVASFIGAGGVRANVLGFADRRPTAEGTGANANARAPGDGRRCGRPIGGAYLRSDSYADGRVDRPGLGRGRIRRPLRRPPAQVRGGDVSRSAGGFCKSLPSQAFAARFTTLKASGRRNWLSWEGHCRVEAARAAGCRSADIHLPRQRHRVGRHDAWLGAGRRPWAWVARLRDPAVRERLKAEIALPSADWRTPP